MAGIGEAVMVWIGAVGLGRSWRGELWLGRSRRSGQGEAGPVTARTGESVMVLRVWVRHCEVW